MHSISASEQELGDNLAVRDGILTVEDRSVLGLVEEFGSPLHVLSRAQLTENYTRAIDAFEDRWDAPFVLHYSVKANPTLAVRRLFSMLGAGGDCMGLNELRLTLASGANPERITLNGNNKEPGSIQLALQHGVRINLDHRQEYDQVMRMARAGGHRARLTMRIKPELDEFGDRVSDLRPMPIAEYAASNKWGVDLKSAIEITRAALLDPDVELEGLHCHLGRQLGDPELFEMLIPGVLRFVDDLSRATDWQPPSLNLGGGLTQGRDPFSAKPRLEGWMQVDAARVPAIEDYAERICASLQAGLNQAGLKTPVLELESGRYLTVNAGLSLTTVGPVKVIGDRRWVNVDIGTHQIGMVRAPNDAHAVIPAQVHPSSETVASQLVGPLCVIDAVTDQISLPPLNPGNVLALLDTGAYADSEATNSNLLGRPAVVMVDGDRAALIKARETFEQVTGRDRVPTWLSNQGY